MKQIRPLAGACFLFVLATIAAAASQNWSQWQGPTRNGMNDEAGLLKAWPEGGPKRVWMFENCGTGYSGPAIVDDRVYILGDRDDTCYLIALDAKTGNELWATPLGPGSRNDWGDGPRSTPTVDNGKIYALTAKGTLACVQASDGKELWQITMEDLGGKEPNWGYAESVLVDGDVVLCTPGGDKGTIAALDKATGQVRWQAAELTDGAQYSSIIKANLHGEPQYVQLLEKRLVAVAPADGRILWQVDWPGRVAVIPTPIAADGKVFCTSGYGAGCMLVDVSESNEPTQVYEDDAKKLMKNHHGGVIKVGDYLYGHSDNVGWLCMEFATGKQVWKEKEALGKGAIGYADGKLYCLSEDDGQVVLIDASPDGWKEHGRFTLDPQTKIRKDKGKIWTHPVVANGKLYLRDQDLVYCYDVIGSPGS
jgi:outer membrane protein assembly factor BamB